jgi:hypothetical protein
MRSIEALVIAVMFAIWLGLSPSPGMADDQGDGGPAASLLRGR